MTVLLARSSPRSVVAGASQCPPQTSSTRIWSTVGSRQSFTVSENHVLLMTACSPIHRCLPNLRPAIRLGELGGRRSCAAPPLLVLMSIERIIEKNLTPFSILPSPSASSV
jgi:hypothetical protein